MDSGDLVTAMRASMSAPGVFAPAQRDGRLLVDGGLVENLPIDTARAMGVDVLIVVDVSFPLYSRDELTSPLEVTNQAFAILIRRPHARAAREAAARPTSSSIRRSGDLRPPTSAACRRRCARARTAARGATPALARSCRSSPRRTIATISPTRNPRATAACRSIDFVRADPRSVAIRSADPGDDERPGRQAARQGAACAAAPVFAVRARSLRIDRLSADRGERPRRACSSTCAARAGVRTTCASV